MKSTEFVAKLKDIAVNKKTLYVMGCFGAPMTAANKNRYTNNLDYNKKRAAMINAATASTFGFDCVCLIKGVLWGWNGDTKASYGGAKYASNGVPDINEGTMIQRCSDVSTSEWDKMQVGEALWLQGHIGVYIGDGLAVECTPKWNNGVQITAVENIGKKSGYNSRKWMKHGKLPYIEYVQEEKPVAKPAEQQKPAAVDPARSKDAAIAGTYVTTAALHLRAGAGMDKRSLFVMPKGAKVQNYGYYTTVNNVKWFYVSYNGIVGFCCSAYLKRA